MIKLTKKEVERAFTQVIGDPEFRDEFSDKYTSLAMNGAAAYHKTKREDPETSLSDAILSALMMGYQIRVTEEEKELEAND